MAWHIGSYDPKLNLVYYGTSNPSPWSAVVRGNDSSEIGPYTNLYSASVLALNPENGQIQWHYQFTPHDAWDYDGVNELVFADLPFDGRKVPVIMQANRNGFFYVLDRANGKLLSAKQFIPVVNWASGIDLKTGRPNFIPENRPGDPTASADGKKGGSIFSAPSFLGGKNQMPMAYSPDTRLFYVPANEWGMEIWNEPVAYKKGAAYLGAGFTIKTVNDDYIGALRAVDP